MKIPDAVKKEKTKHIDEKSASHDYKWGYDDGVDWAIQTYVEPLVEEIKRLHQNNYLSLLEEAAFMGIPEHNRQAFIKDNMVNADFIKDKALSKWQGE